jgi:hypothetical protein
MTSEGSDFAQQDDNTEFSRLDMALCIAFSLGVFAAVGYFAGLGRGRAAGVCAGVDFAVVGLRTQSRRTLRFWLAIVFIVLAQVTVISTVHFIGEHTSVYGLVPAGLMVYLFDQCIIFLSELTSNRSK